MKYKSWVLDILSIVRNAANSPNKSGLIIIVMILVIAFLILYIIDKKIMLQIEKKATMHPDSITARNWIIKNGNI